MDIQIGIVTHFYHKIGVAVVEIMNQPVEAGKAGDVLYLLTK